MNGPRLLTRFQKARRLGRGAGVWARRFRRIWGVARRFRRFSKNHVTQRAGRQKSDAWKTRATPGRSSGGFPKCRAILGSGVRLRRVSKNRATWATGGRPRWVSKMPRITGTKNAAAACFWWASSGIRCGASGGARPQNRAQNADGRECGRELLSARRRRPGMRAQVVLLAGRFGHVVSSGSFRRLTFRLFRQVTSGGAGRKTGHKTKMAGMGCILWQAFKTRWPANERAARQAFKVQRPGGTGCPQSAVRFHRFFRSPFVSDFFGARTQSRFNPAHRLYQVFFGARAQFRFGPAHVAVPPPAQINPQTRLPMQSVPGAPHLGGRLSDKIGRSCRPLQKNHTKYDEIVK